MVPWTPDGARLLAVREALVGAKLQRRFQLLARDTLAVTAEASTLSRLQAFRRFHSAQWKRETLALR